jgi:hypothetical protein
MNNVRDELQRAHEAHTAAQGEPATKKRTVREWFRRAWLRRTSSSR